MAAATIKKDRISIEERRRKREMRKRKIEKEKAGRMSRKEEGEMTEDRNKRKTR